MQTAGDGAADDNDDPVRGDWRDQFTNEYTVTRYQGTYSVNITHRQGKNVEQLRRLKLSLAVIRRETTHGESLTSYTYAAGACRGCRGTKTKCHGTGIDVLGRSIQTKSA